MGHNIYRSPVTLLTLGRNQLKDLVNYLILNRGTVLVPIDSTARMFRMQPLATTPISTLFARAEALGKLGLVSLLNIPTSVKDVPEVITYQHVTFDMLQIGETEPALSRALAAVRFDKRLVVNATPWLTRDGSVSDLLSLHSIIVRDLLVRSYFASAGKTWISPQISRYCAKIYSMSLGALVGGQYGLAFAERQVVAGIFAYFFMSMCVPVADRVKAFQAHSKYFGIDRAADVDQIVDLFVEHGFDKKDMTFDDACNLVGNLGIARMSGFTKHVVQTKAKSWGTDVYTSALALEYPPYFAWLLLMIATGRKTGLAFVLKNLNLEKELRSFGDELGRAPGFLPQL